MRKYIVFALFLYQFSLSAQTPEKALLRFQSYAWKLCVTNEEQLVLTTSAGELAYAPSVKDEWYKAEPVVKDKNGYRIGTNFQQANFFNRDTGFVSGFIEDKSSGKYNIVYHTTDAGRHWKAINFGQDGWVDDAIHLDNGEAWMSVSEGKLAYTADYGVTWKTLKRPRHRQRFANIFFNGSHEGLIGSLENVLAYTIDNCNQWQMLATPLDQKKYRKTNKEARPQIEKVAIFHNYLLVKQEELVFYSKKDSINWMLLPNYSNFYTDPENSALYFQTKHGLFVLADQQLNPVFSSSYIPCSEGQCKNGNLFLMWGEYIVQLKKDHSLATYPIYSCDPSEAEPKFIGFGRDGTYGSRGNKIYVQKQYNGPWEYLLSLPVTDSGYITLISNGRFLFTAMDGSLIYFSEEGKEVLKTTWETMIGDFCATGISKIVFSKGSRGCYHNYSDARVYTNVNGDFELEDEISSGSEHKKFLPYNNKVISGRAVTDFVKKIPGLSDLSNLSTIDDLGFTEKDYEQCKKDILAFQSSLTAKKKTETAFYFNANNIDFTRLVNLVDSIKILHPIVLDNLLTNLHDNWSTTNNWTSLTLVNDKNEVLDIANNYDRSNAFYFPWTISLNGYISSNTSIAINRFINKVYPAFLENKNKVRILHDMVRQLY